MSRLELITDLGIIEKNAAAVRNRIDPGVKVLAIVKADAYGHGSRQVARRLEDKELCDCFAVATALEGLALREAGIKKDILILGYSDEEEMEIAVKNDIQLTVYSEDSLRGLNAVSEKMGKDASAHLKIDTGMNRIGVKNSDALDAVLTLWKSITGIRMAGIFSHFSSADISKEYTENQFDAFIKACERAKAYGFSPVRHISASTAMFDRKYQLDMVRAGISLYGGNEENDVFLPAQTLKSHPVRIIRLKKGEKVGYGMNFSCERDTTVMTVPCGYGDGYPRLLSNRGYVLVNGVKAPIIGNICMDMLMADVTDAGDVNNASEVVLLGEQNGNRITPLALANLSNTIPYEIMLGFSERVKRTWIQ